MSTIDKSATDARTFHVKIADMDGQILIHIVNGYMKGKNRGEWLKGNFIVLRYEEKVSVEKKKLTRMERMEGKCVMHIHILAQEILPYQKWLSKMNILSFCDKIGGKINDLLKSLGYSVERFQIE
jgi:hypothetical protein